MNNLGIIGSGELGLQVLRIATCQKKYNIAGYFDDFEDAETLKHGVRVIGTLDDVVPCIENGEVDVLFLAIGYKQMSARKSIYERFSKYKFASIIHPYSYIDETAQIAQGTIIYPGVIIDKAVTLGENVLVNSGSIISHDSSIGAHSFLSPNVAIAGFVKIGECVNLGISTTVIDHISILSNVQTGGASVIIEDIECPGIYVGNPARLLR